MLRVIALLLLASTNGALAGDSSYIQVLGIAQDAGYPQAGCYQPHCTRGWEKPELKRLAISIAVVEPATGSKYLFDASPDLPEQLYNLHLSAPDDHYTLRGVFLTHAHIGHYTGLMHFGREVMNTSALPVYAMPRMQKFLSTNGPWDQLVRFSNIALMPLADGKAIALSNELSVTPIEVPHRDEYSETVGFTIVGPQKSAIYIPDIDQWSRWDTDIRDLIRHADYALIDASFFADGELPGRDMRKIPHPLVTDSMDLFDDLTAEEKSRVIFIHMNHTNPLLIDGSHAQTEVQRRGFRVAFEGMRLPL